jgi:hypothetical protein
MTARIHFAVINDFGLYADENAACGNNFRRTKKLTDDYREVTCPVCLKALGIEAAELDQLTVCERDPMRRAA